MHLETVLSKNALLICLGKSCIHHRRKIIKTYITVVNPVGLFHKSKTSIASCTMVFYQFSINSISGDELL